MIDKPIAPDSSVSSDSVSQESAVLDSETANAVQTPSTGKQVARATLGIAPLHFVRFVIGFVAQPLIASATGLRWQADAYAVATDILQRVWLIFEKVVNPSFLPVFARTLGEESEERAWRLVSTAFWLTTLLLLLATPLTWFLMPAIVDLYSQKADAQQRALTVSIARLLLSGLFFLGLSSLTYTILNAYKRFFVAALGDVLWKAGIFAGALLSWVQFRDEIKALRDAPSTLETQTRLSDITSQSLLYVTVGFVVGSILKLLPQLLAIGRKWRLLRFRVDFSDPLARQMLLLGVPLLLGIAVSEARGVYLQRLADDPRIQVEAGRAAIKWSRAIGDSLIQVFPYALSIGIFPYLAELARRDEKQSLTDALLGALRVCAWTFIPVTAILIALRLPLLRAVWESGRMTSQDVLLINAPFVGFSVGLIAFSCEMMLNQTFYAMTRAWTPTLIGLASSLFWVVFATYGVNIGWGLAAIALAESLAKGLKCLIMWRMLRPQLGDVKGRENFAFLGKVLASALVAAVIATVCARFLVPENAGKVRGLLGVGVSGALGMAGFVMLTGVLRVRETQMLFGLGRRRRK